MRSSISIRCRGYLSSVCLSMALAAVGCGADGAKPRPPFKVFHAPKQPKTGEGVVVTVEPLPTLETSDLVLQYQVVEPGKYVDLHDIAYNENWTRVALSKAAQETSKTGGAALTAEFPPELQKNRRLIRYRIYSTETKTVLAPTAEDTQRNFAYFVYDGIPEWHGAINPKGSAQERKVVTYEPAVMRSVQAYHLICKQRSIENVTWYEPKHGMGPSASEYKYTATLVADGKVYDHVRIRARGGVWL